jgi:hypothetical protein
MDAQFLDVSDAICVDLLLSLAVEGMRLDRCIPVNDELSCTPQFAVRAALNLLRSLGDESALTEDDHLLVSALRARMAIEEAKHGG